MNKLQLLTPVHEGQCKSTKQGMGLLKLRIQIKKPYELCDIFTVTLH